MPKSPEAQRFDELLDAMLTKPGPDEDAGPASDGPEDEEAEA